MARLFDWLLEAAGEEAIEAVVIGKNEDASRKGSKPPIGKILTWEEAAPYLTYDFYSGHTGPECHPVFAWTASWVIGIAEYDGAVGVARVPRNPRDCMPDFMDVV
jgi:hypothetical protein